MASKTKEEVVRALDWLEECCADPETGENCFKELFGLIVLDRGSELDDIAGMERSALRPGEKRCAVYFADPSRPGQKGAAEKNHAYTYYRPWRGGRRRQRQTHRPAPCAMSGIE